MNTLLFFNAVNFELHTLRSNSFEVFDHFQIIRCSSKQAFIWASFSNLVRPINFSGGESVSFTVIEGSENTAKSLLNNDNNSSKFLYDCFLCSIVMIRNGTNRGLPYAYVFHDIANVQSPVSQHYLVDIFT